MVTITKIETETKITTTVTDRSTNIWSQPVATKYAPNAIKFCETMFFASQTKKVLTGFQIERLGFKTKKSDFNRNYLILFLITLENT